MDVRKIRKEERRLLALLDRADVPTQERDLLAPVIENLAFQRAKLEEARAQMLEADIVVHYDNGGGQEGERENPIFKAYINLFRAYMVGLEKFSSYLPKELQQEVTGAALSVLDMVKNMKKGGGE